MPGKDKLARPTKVVAAAILVVTVSLGVFGFVGNKKLVATLRSIDLETVPVGSTHSIQYQLQNRSSHPIDILGSASSCGCVVTAGLPTEVAAGDTYPLRVNYQATRPGHFIGETIVYLGGGLDPLMLRVLANVELSLDTTGFEHTGFEHMAPP